MWTNANYVTMALAEVNMLRIVAYTNVCIYDYM